MGNSISRKAINALVLLVAVLAIGLAAGCQGTEPRDFASAGGEAGADAVGGSSPGDGGSTSGTGATANTGGTAGTGGEGAGGDSLGAPPVSTDVTSANGRMSGGGYALTFQLGRPTHQPRASGGDLELTCAAPVR